MIREGIDMKKDHDLRWTQVIMAANAPVLYRSVLLDGRTDIGVSASGQVVGLIDDIPSCAGADRAHRGGSQRRSGPARWRAEPRASQPGASRVRAARAG